MINILNVIQNLKEDFIEKTIDKVGEIQLQWNYEDKGQTEMELSGYTEDKDEEIKADLVTNRSSIQKEWQDQGKGLQDE